MRSFCPPPAERAKEKCLTWPLAARSMSAWRKKREPLLPAKRQKNAALVRHSVAPARKLLYELKPSTNPVARKRQPSPAPQAALPRERQPDWARLIVGRREEPWLTALIARLMRYFFED